jgi:hypothetical protein
LHSAAYFENLEVVQKSIEYDADINAKDEDGWTPLFWASRGYYFKDVSGLRLLLEHGADVNARADDGFTPLHRASVRPLCKSWERHHTKKVHQGRCDGITRHKITGRIEHGAE